MSLKNRLVIIILASVLAGGCTALVVGGAGAGGYDAGKDDRQVGTIIDDDGTITAAVKTKIIRSKYVSAGSVDVDTHDGVVTLNGRVDSYFAREQAEQLATETNGVKSVINKLEVKPVSGS